MPKGPDLGDVLMQSPGAQVAAASRHPGLDFLMGDDTLATGVRQIVGEMAKATSLFANSHVLVDAARARSPLHRACVDPLNKWAEVIEQTNLVDDDVNELDFEALMAGLEEFREYALDAAPVPDFDALLPARLSVREGIRAAGEMLAQISELEPSDEAEAIRYGVDQLRKRLLLTSDRADAVRVIGERLSRD